MISSYFKKQKKALDYYFSHLDEEQCHSFLRHILECEGVLITTGVGKSGYIAQKIAATLMSTGTKAFYLSPVDALHGDLGMVTSKDTLIVFSKSGETEELLQIFPYARNKGAKIGVITSNSHSRLAKSADFFITLPCSQELCPLDLAPTTSTTIQLLFGDALAMTLMDTKGTSIEQFSENHPAGRIGKRVTMKVKDLMLTRQRTPTCRLEDRLEEILGEYSKKQCGCMVVTDARGLLHGIFTDGDLRRAFESKGDKALKEFLKNLMTRTPRVIGPEDLAWEAIKRMESNQKSPITVLPVVTPENELVGIIRMHDLLQAGL